LEKFEKCPKKFGAQVLPMKKLGVNFTNILRAAFFCESFVQSFFVLTFLGLNFFMQEYKRKCAHKMLVKLTPKLHLQKQNPARIL
jgi:hypothetical protein